MVEADPVALRLELLAGHRVETGPLVGDATGLGGAAGTAAPWQVLDLETGAIAPATAVAGFSAASGAAFSWGAFAKKIFTFAPLLSLLLALLLLPVTYPEWLDVLLRRLGATLVPLALVSVGFQLRLSAMRGRIPLLAIGLGFKLLIGPALVVAVLAGLLGQRGPVIQITAFEAAMGPMIGAAIVAMDHDLDPSLVTLMVGLGIPLSFATLPAWWWVLERVA